MKLLNSILLCMLLLISLASYSENQKVDPEVVNKIDEINEYDSLEGVWEGSYIVKSAPEKLYDLLKSDGVLESGVGVKVILKEDEKPKVLYKNKTNSDWEESGGQVELIPDKLGFHLFIAREGGVWLERVIISFARVSNRSAEMTFTRTVHNWFSEKDVDAPKFYSVFGSGSANKI